MIIMDIHEVTLKRQIDFNNQWPKIKSLELESVKKFRQKLSDQMLEQVFIPMLWDERKTSALFARNRAIAKIFSSTLDMYDVLPFSPDIAFDIIWRALEISMKFMSQNSWGYTAKKCFEDVLCKTCADIIAPLANHEPCIKDLFESLIEKTSVVSLRYLVARLYFRMDLSVSPQVEFVRKRTNEILGADVVEAIRNKYVGADGKMDASNQRNAARLLLLILRGKEVDIEGNVLKPLELEKRVELYVSCVIYSSRCERFHGDYYSPLKSSLADLATYYEYYFLLIYTYFLWGIVMFKIQQLEGEHEALTVSAMCDSISKSLSNLAILPNK